MGSLNEVRKILDEFSSVIGFDICNSSVYLKAKSYQLLEAYEVYSHNLNMNQMATLCSELGRIYANQGQEQQAFEYFTKGLNLAKKNKDDKQQAILYSYIANTYMLLGSYHEALKNFHKERNCFHQLALENEEITERIFLMNINIGLSYCSVEKFEMARMYIRILEEKRFLHVNDKYRILVNTLRIKTYYGSNDMESAIFYIRQLIQDSILQNNNGYFMVYYDIFLLLLELNQQIEAGDLLKIIQDIAENTDLDYHQLIYADVKVKYYKKFGDKISYISSLKEFRNKSLKQESILREQKQLRVLQQYELYRTQVENKRLLKTMSALKVKSEHDELTKLPNRYRLNEYAQEKFEAAMKNKLPFGIDIIDVDYFKEYNDNFGHLNGDKCLVMIADVLREIAVEHFVARFGGDEFFIVFFGRTFEEVKQTAEEIQCKLEQINISQAKDLPYSRVTLSHGLVNMIPEEGQDLLYYIQMADTALNQGKKVKRNTINYS